MTLMMRVSRMFKADMHGLLDRLEEPEAVVRQALRDMEEEIGAREARLGALRLEIARYGQRIERLARDLSDLDAKLTLCLAADAPERDGLARAVVRKQLEAAGLRRIFEARRAEAVARAEAQGRELDEFKEKLASVRQKAELLCDRPVPDQDDGDPMRSLVISDDDVEIALMREREKRGAKVATKGGGA